MRWEVNPLDMALTAARLNQFSVLAIREVNHLILSYCTKRENTLVETGGRLARLSNLS